MFGRGNGNGGGTFEHPLPHRPGVVVVELDDGRRKIVGDGCPFSPRELSVLSGDLPASALDDAPALTDAERERIAEAAEAVAVAVAVERAAFAEAPKLRISHTATHVKTSGELEAAQRRLHLARCELRRLTAAAKRAAFERQNPTRYALTPSMRRRFEAYGIELPAGDSVSEAEQIAINRQVADIEGASRRRPSIEARLAALEASD